MIRDLEYAISINDYTNALRIFNDTLLQHFKARDILWYVRTAIYNNDVHSLCRAFNLASNNKVPGHIKLRIAKEIYQNGYRIMNSQNAFDDYEMIEKLLQSNSQININTLIKKNLLKNNFNHTIKSYLQNNSNKFNSKISYSGNGYINKNILKIFNLLDLLCLKNIYDLPTIPKVQEFRNVYVTHDGTVMDETFKKILHNRYYTLPKKPIGKSLAAVKSINIAFFVGNKTKGFYHWFTEQFPLLVYHYSQNYSSLPLLFLNNTNKFVLETLKLLFKPMPNIIDVGDIIKVKKLFVVKGNNLVLSRRKLHNIVYDPLVINSKKITNNFSLGNKIYISRKKSVRRKFKNENELEFHLAKYDFKAVCLEDLPLAKQISIISNANIIVACHGSGLAHIASCKPETKIFEIIPTDVSYSIGPSWELKFSFISLSRMLGFNHRIYFQYINPLKPEYNLDITNIIEDINNFINTK